MSNDPIAELSRTISVHWKAIDEAAATAQKKRSELAKLFSHGPINYVPGDTNIVVFGSLARNELTSQSDLDWTLLIDGHANANHQKTAIGIKKLIEAKNAEIGLKPPGPTGIFGSMTFSHDLIHRIGGEADTNRNMTQRILLLLESANLADNGSGAHDRVKAGILNRYLEEQEPNYLTRTDEQYRVPRFLLNDIVRFWRTMAVDFASKQRDRGGDGWGLRNAKLRMSRKLIFVSGLLTCFNAHLQVPVNPELKQPDAQIEPILNFLKQQAKLTPLEILADTVLTRNIDKATIQRLFDSYNMFLGLLNDDDKRTQLDELRAENARTSKVFSEMRDISVEFQRGLNELFFHKSLDHLTKEYGIF